MYVPQGSWQRDWRREIRDPELILVLVEESREARVRQIPSPLLPSLL